MTVTVVEMAEQLSDLAAAADDPDFTNEAIRAGLRPVPACEELWRRALRLAQRFGSPDDVSAVATQMYDAIAAHGSPRGATAETDALVDELLPGFRRDVA